MDTMDIETYTIFGRQYTIRRQDFGEYGPRYVVTRDADGSRLLSAFGTRGYATLAARHDAKRAAS